MLQTILRDYQYEACDQVTRGFQQEIPGEGGPYTKQLLVEPAGSGKTLIFAALPYYYHDH